MKKSSITRQQKNNYSFYLYKTSCNFFYRTLFLLIQCRRYFMAVFYFNTPVSQLIFKTTTLQSFLQDCCFKGFTYFINAPPLI